jgi:hypothetical protein
MGIKPFSSITACSTWYLTLLFIIPGAGSLTRHPVKLDFTLEAKEPSPCFLANPETEVIPPLEKYIFIQGKPG